MGASCILKKEQLLLTLMKLRINLPHADLAYRFDISSAQVLNIVITWIYMLEHVLGNKITVRTIPSTYKNQDFSRLYRNKVAYPVKVQ